MVQYPCPTCQFTLANPRDFTPSSTRNACENYHQGNTPCCDMRQMPQNTGRTGRTGNQGHTTGAATVCKHDASQVPQNTGRTGNQGHTTGAATVCKHDAGQVPQNTGRTSNQGHSTGAATVCKHDAACRSSDKTRSMRRSDGDQPDQAAQPRTNTPVMSARMGLLFKGVLVRSSRWSRWSSRKAARSHVR
jgi:hypothetical protein